MKDSNYCLTNCHSKLPDKPPLLSEEEVTDAQVKYIETYEKDNGVILNFPLRGWLREDCVKQAQREADIKWYKEELNKCSQ